jgi:hypothetical protein
MLRRLRFGLRTIPTNRAIQRVEKNFRAQLDLLAEMAAAYVEDGRPVPPEVGEALGLVEHRRRAFMSIKDILAESKGGPGVKELVQRYLQTVKSDSNALERVLEVCGT